MKNGREIKVAVAALVAIVLLFYGINFLKGRTLGKKSSYVVVFDNVTGLTADNAVFANGFSVGTVGSIAINYERPDEIYVRIDLDKSVRLPKGTRAEIETSMMGSTTMRLVLGESEEMLSPGDSLRGGVYRGALDQVGELMPSLEAMLPKLDSILDGVNAIVSDPAIRGMVANAERVTGNLTTTTEDLNRLLEGDVPRLMARLEAVSGNVETLTANLNATDYAETIRRVNETLEGTQQLMETLEGKVNSREGSLGLLLNDRELYDNLTRMAADGDSLVTDLKAHPKRYVHFSVFGKKE